MKKNDIISLKTKTIEELSRMALDLRDEIGKGKSENSLKKARNTNAVKNKRKDLARVMTFLSMKSISSQKETKGGSPSEKASEEK